MEFNPAFIDVTYHREEYEYVEREDGLLEKRVVKKRPGTVGICAAIQNKYGVDAVPHILCGGYERTDKEWIESGYASREAKDKASNNRLLNDLYRMKGYLE